MRHFLLRALLGRLEERAWHPRLDGARGPPRREEEELGVQAGALALVVLLEPVLPLALARLGTLHALVWHVRCAADGCNPRAIGHTGGLLLPQRFCFLDQRLACDRRVVALAVVVVAQAWLCIAFTHDLAVLVGGQRRVGRGADQLGTGGGDGSCLLLLLSKLQAGLRRVNVGDGGAACGALLRQPSHRIECRLRFGKQGGIVRCAAVGVVHRCAAIGPGVERAHCGDAHEERHRGKVRA